MSHTSVLNWKSQCSEVCEKWMKNQKCIGGEGVIVEIGMTRLANTRGQYLKNIPSLWVLGGLERVSNAIFIIPLEEKNASVVTPLIRQFVIPGTIIISENEPAYSYISNCGYVHKVSCKDNNNLEISMNGTHTHSIEQLWKCMKRKISELDIKQIHNRKTFAHFFYLSQNLDETTRLHHFLLTIAGFYTPSPVETSNTETSGHTTTAIVNNVKMMDVDEQTIFIKEEILTERESPIMREEMISKESNSIDEEVLVLKTPDPIQVLEPPMTETQSQLICNAAPVSICDVSPASVSNAVVSRASEPLSESTPFKNTTSEPICDKVTEVGDSPEEPVVIKREDETTFLLEKVALNKDVESVFIKEEVIETIKQEKTDDIEDVETRQNSRQEENMEDEWIPKRKSPRKKADSPSLISVSEVLKELEEEQPCTECSVLDHDVSSRCSKYFEMIIKSKWPIVRLHKFNIAKIKKCGTIPRTQYRKTSYTNVEARRKMVAMRKAGHSISAISREIRTNRTTVRKWLRRNAKEGLLKDHRGDVSRRITSPEEDRAILEYFRRHPNASAIDVNRELGLTISHTTTMRRLKDIANVAKLQQVTSLEPAAEKTIEEGHEEAETEGQTVQSPEEVEEKEVGKVDSILIVKPWKRPDPKGKRPREYKSRNPGRPEIGPLCNCGCMAKLGSEKVKELYDDFWALSSVSAQNEYITKLVSSRGTKRSRVKDRQPRQSRRMVFTVCSGDAVQRVCRIGFYHIHGVTECRVRSIVYKHLEDRAAERTEEPLVNRVKEYASLGVACLAEVSTMEPFRRAEDFDSDPESGFPETPGLGKHLLDPTPTDDACSQSETSFTEKHGIEKHIFDNIVNEYTKQPNNKLLNSSEQVNNSTSAQVVTTKQPYHILEVVDRPVENSSSVDTTKQPDNSCKQTPLVDHIFGNGVRVDTTFQPDKETLNIHRPEGCIANSATVDATKLACGFPQTQQGLVSHLVSSSFEVDTTKQPMPVFVRTSGLVNHIPENSTTKLPPTTFVGSHVQHTMRDYNIEQPVPSLPHPHGIAKNIPGNIAPNYADKQHMPYFDEPQRIGKSILDNSLIDYTMKHSIPGFAEPQGIGKTISDNSFRDYTTKQSTHGFVEPQGIGKTIFDNSLRDYTPKQSLHGFIEPQGISRHMLDRHIGDFTKQPEHTYSEAHSLGINHIFDPMRDFTRQHMPAYAEPQGISRHMFNHPMKDFAKQPEPGFVDAHGFGVHRPLLDNFVRNYANYNQDLRFFPRMDDPARSYYMDGNSTSVTRT